MPSTWPCTTWPPRRSVGRSGSSRLTGVPSRASASEERRSVSCITSAEKCPSAIRVAVRQTPLTATESPSAISGARPVRTASRTPSAPASTAETVPRSWTSPVNTSPLPQPRGDQDVVGDTLDVEAQRAGGLGDLLDALALERVARARAADHHGRDEQPDLVDLAGVEERAGQVRAALEQDRGDPGGAELVERRAHARGLVLARGHDDVGAGDLERIGGQAPGRPRDHHRERDLAGAAHELGVQRQPRLGVEHHAARLAGDAGDAGGEQRVVGQRSADPDGDRVALGAPVVGELAAGLAGDPLRVAGARGHLAVERHRRLEQHVRAARAGVLAERLVEQPGARGELAVGDEHLDALVAQDAQAAAGGLLGRVVGRDDDAGDAGVDDRVGARRRAPVVAARLERDVHRRAAGVGHAAGRQRLALGVRASVRDVVALAEHLAVLHHDGSDERVRRRPPAPAARELDGPGEMWVIGLKERAHEVGKRILIRESTAAASGSMSVMRKLLLLPVTLPFAAARGALEAVVETVIDALTGDLEPAPPPSPAPAPSWTQPEPWPPEPPERPEPPEPPEPPIKLHDDEPTRGEVNRRRLEEREAEGGAVGAEIRVDAPWDDYDSMSAREVLDRLVGADEATRAVVRLYEGVNRNRATVLRATEA